ncbi:MAG: ribulose kinase [Planctomycetota bacterium]|nr:MAG: ribulose kinase [Planctomycetota bacterium]
MHAEPQKEHQWLQRLVGEWTFEAECSMGPDQPPMKSTGSEVVRSLGGLWTIGEGQGEMPDGGGLWARKRNALWDRSSRR